MTVADPSAVYLGGERRKVPVCCPGGVAWQPAVGETVLVLKAGSEGEQPYILGMTGIKEKLLPGQVRLGSSGCGILCGERLELNGNVMINGESLETLVRRVAGGIMGGQEE